MKKVKVTDLWNYIGCTINIPEELSTKYLDSGTYVVCEKNDGYRLLGNMGIYCLDNYTNDDEVLVFVTSAEDKLDNLIEYNNKLILSLIEDGWTSGGHLDLDPYYNKLKELINLKEINYKDN